MLYTYFDIAIIYLKILFFKVPMNHCATIDFFSLCVRHNSISLPWNYDFGNPLQSSQIFLCLVNNLTQLKSFEMLL